MQEMLIFLHDRREEKHVCVHSELLHGGRPLLPSDNTVFFQLSVCMRVLQTSLPAIWRNQTNFFTARGRLSVGSHPRPSSRRLRFSDLFLNFLTLRPGHSHIWWHLLLAGRLCTLLTDSKGASCVRTKRWGFVKVFENLLEFDTFQRIYQRSKLTSELQPTSETREKQSITS